MQRSQPHSPVEAVHERILEHAARPPWSVEELEACLVVYQERNDLFGGRGPVSVFVVKPIRIRWLVEQRPRRGGIQ
jgi:hypothetical protein